MAVPLPQQVGPPVARALLARDERATQMKTGPKLTAAVEDREARIKEFALRTQRAANRLARGKQVGRGGTHRRAGLGCARSSRQTF